MEHDKERLRLLTTATRRAYRGVTTRRREDQPMSAQPDHAPVTPYAPAPGAPAELLAQLRADRRAAQWVPAFEQEWAAALEESRGTFSLAGLYEVVQDWQGRLAHAPAVDAFVTSGYDDDSEVVDMAELRGRRR
ncbi:MULTISPECIES: DUF6247 family protein [unclassified Streptomyces]|uniref:DUF6247 family protein n=1 Tax=unclassified Streptomyces TaxID=2593676 RepID=UPI0033AC009D